MDFGELQLAFSGSGPLKRDQLAPMLEPPKKPEPEGFSPDVLDLYGKIEKSRDKGLDKTVNPETISQDLEDLYQEFAPDASEEEKVGSQLLAVRRLNTGESTPGMKAVETAIKQNPDDADVVIEAFKNKQGGDSTESMGALLSLVLPVLAGAAIGGKRGALAAFKGGGQYMADKMKEEDKLEKASELQAEKDRRQMEKETRQNQEKRDFEDYKRRLDETEEGDKDWLESKIIPAQTRARLVSAGSTVSAVDELASRFDKLSKIPAGAKLEALDPGSDAALAFTELQAMIPTIIKAYGDTGNIAVAERKMIEAALVGNIIANGPDMGKRLRRIAENLENKRLADTKKWKEATTKGGDSLLESVRKDPDARPLTSRQEKVLAKWREAGFGADKAALAFAEMGEQVNTAAIYEFYE